MKRLTAPCLCTVNHCCRAEKQKQYLVAAPVPVKAVKPSPLISSSSLLLMTARRLRAIVIFLLQGSNAEAAPTSSPLLIQHQLLPPLPPCRCRRCRCVIAVAALAAARRSSIFAAGQQCGSSAYIVAAPDSTSATAAAAAVSISPLPLCHRCHRSSCSTPPARCSSIFAAGQQCRSSVYIVAAICRSCISMHPSKGDPNSSSRPVNTNAG